MASQPDFLSLDELAGLVHDGDRLCIGGLLFTRLPLALLKAVIAAGRRDFHYVAWGGGLPLELLLAADAVRKVTFCFSSLDLFGLAPLFRQAVEEGRIELDEWSALGMIQGFHAAEQNLPSLPFQVPYGSDLLKKSGYASVYADPVSGRSVAAARALPIDSLLLHVGRADADGNIEIQGALGLDRSAIGAAKQVLVTAEEIVPSGTFQRERRGQVFSRRFIRAIAQVESGAAPTSCLPYYIADMRALYEASQQTPLHLEPPAENRQQLMAAAAQIPASRVRPPEPRIALDAPTTPDEQMVVTLARMYTDDSICAAGAVSPLAVTSYLLAKRTHAPGLSMLMVSAGLVDIAVRPMLLYLAESLDFQTSVLHCGGDDTYHQYYQRGRVSHEVVSAAQIDRFGRANNIQITTPSGKIIRLPGQGGMADVANLHQNFVLYLTRHSPLTLVNEVEYASAGRGLVRDDERQAAGLRPGYTRLVTNLGMFELNPETGLLELIALHPGVTLEHIQAQTGFPIQTAAQVTTTEPPSAEELRLLRTEIDPLGLRRLEFVPSKDRAALLQELLNTEENLIREWLP